MVGNEVAVVGGAIEYLALITGYQALLLVVAGLYAGAYAFATRARFLADRDLVPDHTEASTPGPLDAIPAQPPALIPELTDRLG